MQEHLFRRFSSPGHSGFGNDVSVTLIDKMDPSDSLQLENFWRETLMTMTPLGLILKTVSEFYHFDNI